MARAPAGCDVTVLHESYTSDVTGDGRRLGYQPADSRDVVEAVTSPQDTRWARVTHSTTYHSVVTGKTFGASFVFTLQGTAVWAVKYRPNLSS